MAHLKKIFLLLGILLIMAVDIFIYWNQHLYFQSKDTEGITEKLSLLAEANSIYPLNDLIDYEMGKVFFEVAMDSLGDRDKCVVNLKSSVTSLRKSILINPASQFSHLYLARALRNLDTLSVPTDLKYVEEYRKAASLVSFNSDIYLEVAKLFLSDWQSLSDEDKEFTLEMMRQIWKTADSDKIFSLLKIWEMNAKDYEIVREVIPDDADSYRLYARFLGETSLSLQERYRYLARYEFLQYQKAKTEFNAAENSLRYYRTKEAVEGYQESLSSLDRIKFYQNLSRQTLISENEFSEIQKLAYLGHAKSLIEDKQDFSEYSGHLYTYLEYEPEVALVKELEDYLIEQEVLKERPGENFDEIELFLLHLRLYFEQHKIKEIIRIGRLFQRGFDVLPEVDTAPYIGILQLLGDCYEKVGNLYDSGDMYRRALEIDPNHLGTLLKLRHNLSLLDDKEELTVLNVQIAKSLSPKRLLRNEIDIQRTRRYLREYLFDGEGITLDFRFKQNWESNPPLITIVMNGKVVWEDYLAEEALSLFLDTRGGINILEIAPVIQSIQLTALVWSPGKPDREE